MTSTAPNLICRKCGAYLRTANIGKPLCDPCEEQAFKNQLFPPVSVTQAVKTTPSKKDMPSYYRRKKGKCDCCRRGPLVLVKSRAGDLCNFCRERIVGIFGPELTKRLAEIKIEAREYENFKRRNRRVRG